METGAPRGGSGIHWEWPPFSRGPFSLGVAIKTRGCPPHTLCQTFCCFPFHLSLCLFLPSFLSFCTYRLSSLTVKRKVKPKNKTFWPKKYLLPISSRKKVFFLNGFTIDIRESFSWLHPHHFELVRRKPSKFVRCLNDFLFLFQGRTCHENRPNRSQNTGKILKLY